MRVGDLMLNKRNKSIGVVVEVMGKGRYLKVVVHWLGDTQTNGWLWAYNNGMEVL